MIQALRQWHARHGCLAEATTTTPSARRTKHSISHKRRAHCDSKARRSDDLGSRSVRLFSSPRGKRCVTDEGTAEEFGSTPAGIERKTNKMIRLDLAAARDKWRKAAAPGQRKKREQSDFLRYKNAAGRYVDFHILRHFFITSLERAGVSPNMAQTLARHSDIRLTLGVYTHVELQNQTAANGALAGPVSVNASKF